MALPELAVDLEVVLAQHERDDRGGKGHTNRNDEDGVVGCVVESARAPLPSGHECATRHGRFALVWGS